MRRNRELPAAWLPLLKQHGLDASGSTAPTPVSISGLGGATAAGVQPRLESTVAELQTPSQPDEATTGRLPEPAALILKYHLLLGEKAGLSPLDTLARVADDLRLAGLEASIPYDLLAAALTALVREH